MIEWAFRKGSNPDDTEVVVVGLGRFGSALAETVVDLGYEVLAIDRDPALVEAVRASGRVTHVVEADATDTSALRQLGVSRRAIAVVAIGADLESSVLATAALVDLGLENIWAKALNERHGQILRRIGAHHVVLPEVEVGTRIAHLLTGRMVEYVELQGDGDFRLVETSAPAHLWGKELGATNVRQDHRVTVVCISHRNAWTYATSETQVSKGDFLLVAGAKADVAEFSNLP